MTFERIAQEEYFRFLSKYNKEHPCERLGQAFLNKYFPNVVHPTLFYTINYKEANTIIAHVYVNFISNKPVEQDPEHILQ